MGIAAGVGTGALVGMLRAAGVRAPVPLTAVGAAALPMALANGPMAALDVSHPTEWGAKDWAADVIRHLGYGAIGAVVLRALDPPA